MAFAGERYHSDAMPSRQTRPRHIVNIFTAWTRQASYFLSLASLLASRFPNQLPSSPWTSADGHKVRCPVPKPGFRPMVSGCLAVPASAQSKWVDCPPSDV
ncbi:uncharacterized protein SPSK_08173 [Sporothrix schenckii 1099-18]|uniref:Uncharacterized protein n=1 Tax=Sporothrix schenckii 1099-18 TaxID=1397361 RepID=A0A0F2MK34_SPOSC|nr:uncharacterized protein SPSK_08173 [Sporothrix schenckii 1099-18]KJR88541.1 hypothetical protein SPSK_08173 [Sporothrix schenckii 1099-18]